MKRVVIIGGGIAGLAAAHRSLSLPERKIPQLEVTLLEASHRLGGAIATERVGDFLVEAGPDSSSPKNPGRCASVSGSASIPSGFDPGRLSKDLHRS